MKATIDKFGKLTVWPENSIEAYALSKWTQDSLLGTEYSVKQAGNIDCYLGRTLKILTEEQE